MNKAIRKQIRSKYKNDYKANIKEVEDVSLVDLATKLVDDCFVYPKWKKVVKEFTFQWSRRMTAVAGRCFYNKKIIRLSVDYHRKHPEQIENTLAHELIHMLIRGHGDDFVHEMRIVNRKAGKKLITIHSDERSKVKYVGYCPECERVVGTKSRRTEPMNDGRGYYHRECGTTIEWVEIM